MKTNLKNLPEIVNREEWLTKRKEFLKKEKKFTDQRDALNTERRKLPMVEIEKDYHFKSPKGNVSLLNLFDGHSQLIVYHFMMDPNWEEGCPSCSYLTDNIGHLSHLHARDTNLVLISRAPLEKIEKYQARMGWTIPWYSSYENDFNYDFHVTIDEEKGSDEYNYKKLKDLGKKWEGWTGEMPGTSVFLHHQNRIFHTYSTYARGLDILLGTYNFLDLTPLGRQEDWEEPAGRCDSKFMKWLKRHDNYEHQ